MQELSMSKSSFQVGARLICATRALKNAKYLQQVAPQIMPREEPLAGFGSVIPLPLLAQLHRKTRPTDVPIDPNLAALLERVTFPPVSTSVKDPLFDGTLFFARLQFTIKDQGNQVFSVNEADTQTALDFTRLSLVPISLYASQYGPNTIFIAANVLSFEVTLTSSSYNDAQLQTWINAIASQNDLPSSACLAVLNPQNEGNTDANPAEGIL